MANSNDKLTKLKERLANVESKISTLTAERKTLKEEIKATQDAQIVELIRTAAPDGETTAIAEDFAAFMREREAQSGNEAAASGVTA